MPGRSCAIAHHPGCIYGEMGRCMRPCQQAVGVEEYRSEATRVAEFLRTGGRSLLLSASGERDRLSAAMDFEGAARAHQRVQKIEEVLGWRDEMARDVEELHAIAIVPSAQPERSNWAGCVADTGRDSDRSISLRPTMAGLCRSIHGCARWRDRLLKGGRGPLSNGWNDWRCFRAGFIPAGAMANC